MTKKVKISYPEVPAKLVSNFNDLITALNTTGSNLKSFLLSLRRLLTEVAAGA